MWFHWLCHSPRVWVRRRTLKRPSTTLEPTYPRIVAPAVVVHGAARVVVLHHSHRRVVIRRRRTVVVRSWRRDATVARDDAPDGRLPRVPVPVSVPVTVSVTVPITLPLPFAATSIRTQRGPPTAKKHRKLAHNATTEQRLKEQAEGRRACPRTDHGLCHDRDPCHGLCRGLCPDPYPYPCLPCPLGRCLGRGHRRTCYHVGDRRRHEHRPFRHRHHRHSPP